ncbi:DUF3489 domain-containing protein [Salipiger bermudensis]|uniref:DUF3489 domain-containing protein n=1 Tax=Salipiger bermudensis TaxID=344736 RepID=UPI00300BEA48
MSASPASKPKETKRDLLRKLLTRKSGADLAALQKATGWKPHTGRAALSTLRKAGYSIDRQPPRTKQGGAVYRIIATPEKA